ncbi:sulfurtransferase TusA family protein [Ferrimonas gelatinilytica]|uniref:Sulfurtransferase TusA family protein n=1 Tax=Ferrimonas gelatinilytica TaxID=1255257 RepID=A0ABP9S2S3_9GAMM
MSKSELTLDLRQERCPLAFVKAKLAIQAHDAMAPLTILISDPGTRRDVPRWLEKTGYHFELLTDPVDGLRVRVLSKQLGN